MYFYEVLRSCDETALTAAFLPLCADLPHPDETMRCFRQMLADVTQLAPLCSASRVLHLETVTDDPDEEAFIHVCMEEGGERFGILASPWREVLGAAVCEAEVRAFGECVYAANVLWEMCYFGFDEQTIRASIEEMLRG